MELLKLEKRECPIKISLTPLGGYYLLVEFEINGDKHELCPSLAVGWHFLEFMSAAYMLYSENGGCDCHNHAFLPRAHHYFREIETNATNPRLKENEMSVETSIEWNEEGPTAKISLYRKVENENLAPITNALDPIRISIEYNNSKTNENKTSTYNVEGKDLSYAIAKAGTDAIKKYGFHGYFYSTGHDDCTGDWIDINQLLFFKALSLLAILWNSAFRC